MSVLVPVLSRHGYSDTFNSSFK